MIVVPRVWLEAWQVQCCGTSFGIGSRVAWQVGSRRGDAFVRRVLGDDLASSIDYVEDHHGQIDEPIELRGDVMTITAAFCRFGPSAEGNMVPLTGTTRTEARSAVDREDEAPGGMLLVGYVVDVACGASSALP
jgi:hypothetical protein